MKRFMVATLAIFVALAFAAAAGAQEAKPDGKTLFLDKKCNSCHTLKALGIQKRTAAAEKAEAGEKAEKAEAGEKAEKAEAGAKAEKAEAGEKAEKGEAAGAKVKSHDLSSVGLDLKADWMTKFLKRTEATKAGKKHVMFKGTDDELATITAWLEEQKAPKSEAVKTTPKKTGAK